MITIVDYDDICIEKVAQALDKITKDFKISGNELDICSSDKIILAGCGSAAAVMKKIQLLNLYSILRVVKKPMLGIGLGLQLMSSYSTEGNFPCLGFFPGSALKIDDADKETFCKGMHKVDCLKSSVLFNGIETDAEFFFNNDYYLPRNEFSTSICKNTFNVTSSIEKDNAYGVQFHPEMSGDNGLKLLKNFIEM